jgi:hypothetical protein
MGECFCGERKLLAGGKWRLGGQTFPDERRCEIEETRTRVLVDKLRQPLILLPQVDEAPAEEGDGHGNIEFTLERP